MTTKSIDYKSLLLGIKTRVRQGQTKIFQSANAEMGISER